MRVGACFRCSVGFWCVSGEKWPDVRVEAGKRLARARRPLIAAINCGDICCHELPLLWDGHVIFGRFMITACVVRSVPLCFTSGWMIPEFPHRMFQSGDHFSHFYPTQSMHLPNLGYCLLRSHKLFRHQF